VNCPTMCGYYYLYFPTTSVLFTGPLIQVGPIWFSPKSNNAAAVKKAINAAFLAAGFTNYVSDVLDRNDSFYNVNLYIDLNLLYQATGLSRLTLPYYQNGAWQFPNVKTDLQSAVNYPVLWEDTTQVKLPIIYSSQVQSLSSLLCKGAQSDTLYVHNIGTRTLIVSSVGIVSQNGNGSFSLPNMSFPDSISPGDSIPFIMQFIPSSVGIETGVLSINSNDSSNQPWQIVFNANVFSPEISVQQTLSTQVCPFIPDTLYVSVTNNDTMRQEVTFNSSCGLSQPSAMLVSKQIDTVAVFLAPVAAGTDTFLVHVNDECGIDHDMKIIEHVQTFPALSFSIETDTNPVVINDLAKAYLIVDTPVAFSGMYTGTLSFNVSNERSALLFDTVFSQWGDIEVSNINADSLQVMLQLNQTPVSDTLATLYYRTFVGSTYAPYVRLNSESSQYPCQTVTGANDAVVHLMPACPYDSLVVGPYTSSLVSVAPNPATGIATITYSTVESEMVTIGLYNEFGRKVQTVYNGWRQRGMYNTEVNTQGIKDGIYFVSMQVGRYRGMMKLIVIR
ncbi:MAG TPA: T9SS type A sorting domain-containing protein, partial [Candidatus Kapabacteria bacterium]|nr:T9SS type A sorting domain-containing protein [Candidatus Kapabacteria bacterium]